jgi:hypothetical protein
MPPSRRGKSSRHRRHEKLPGLDTQWITKNSLSTYLAAISRLDNSKFYELIPAYQSEITAE